MDYRSNNYSDLRRNKSPKNWRKGKTRISLLLCSYLAYTYNTYLYSRRSGWYLIL